EVDPEEVAPTDIEESAPETAAEPVDLEEDDDTTEEDVNPEIAQEKSPTQPPPSSNTKKTSPSKAPASRAKKAKPVKPVKPKVDYSKVPWTYHQKRCDLGASLGVGWINDPAFDLFQAKNAH